MEQQESVKYLISEKEYKSLNEAIMNLTADSFSHHQVEVIEDLKSIRDKIKLLPDYVTLVVKKVNQNR